MRRLVAGRLVVAVSAIGLLAGLCACSANGTGGSADGLVIGSVHGFTGDLGALGEPADKAIRLAGDQASAAARSAGLDIEVQVREADSQSDPQAAVAATRQVVDAGANCLVGPSSTPEATAMLNAVTKLRRVPMLPSASSTRLTPIDDDGTIFRTVPADDLQAAALVQGVEQVLGGARGRTLAIGYQNSPYGEGLADAVAEGWRARGGTVSGPVGYDPTQASYDSEAARLVEGDVDAYMIADFPETFGKVAAALLRTGRFTADRLFVPDALAVSPVPDIIPAAALNGAYGTRAGTPVGTPQAAAFDELYRGAPGPGRSSLDSNNFDAAILCFLARVAADSGRPGDIADALPAVAGAPGDKFSYLELPAAVSALRDGRDIDYDGVSGPIDFDENGDATSALYDLFRFTDGEIAVQSQLTVEEEG